MSNPASIGDALKRLGQDITAIESHLQLMAKDPGHIAHVSDEIADANQALQNLTQRATATDQAALQLLQQQFITLNTRFAQEKARLQPTPPPPPPGSSLRPPASSPFGSSSQLPPQGSSFSLPPLTAPPSAPSGALSQPAPFPKPKATIFGKFNQYNFPAHYNRTHPDQPQLNPNIFSSVCTVAAGCVTEQLIAQGPRALTGDFMDQQLERAVPIFGRIMGMKEQRDAGFLADARTEVLDVLQDLGNQLAKAGFDNPYTEAALKTLDKSTEDNESLNERVVNARSLLGSPIGDLRAGLLSIDEFGGPHTSISEVSDSCGLRKIPRLDDKVITMRSFGVRHQFQGILDQFEDIDGSAACIVTSAGHTFSIVHLKDAINGNQFVIYDSHGNTVVNQGVPDEVRASHFFSTFDKSEDAAAWLARAFPYTQLDFGFNRADQDQNPNRFSIAYRTSAAQRPPQQQPQLRPPVAVTPPQPSRLSLPSLSSVSPPPSAPVRPPVQPPQIQVQVEKPLYEQMADTIEREIHEFAELIDARSNSTLEGLLAKEKTIKEEIETLADLAREARSPALDARIGQFREYLAKIKTAPVFAQPPAFSLSRYSFQRPPVEPKPDSKGDDAARRDGSLARGPSSSSAYQPPRFSLPSLPPLSSTVRPAAPTPSPSSLITPPPVAPSRPLSSARPVFPLIRPPGTAVSAAHDAGNDSDDTEDDEPSAPSSTQPAVRPATQPQAEKSVPEQMADNIEKELHELFRAMENIRSTPAQLQSKASAIREQIGTLSDIACGVPALGEKIGQFNEGLRKAESSGAFKVPLSFSPSHYAQPPRTVPSYQPFPRLGSSAAPAAQAQKPEEDDYADDFDDEPTSPVRSRPTGRNEFPLPPSAAYDGDGDFDDTEEPPLRAPSPIQGRPTFQSRAPEQPAALPPASLLGRMAYPALSSLPPLPRLSSSIRPAPTPATPSAGPMNAPPSLTIRTSVTSLTVTRNRSAGLGLPSGTVPPRPSSLLPSYAPMAPSSRSSGLAPRLPSSTASTSSANLGLPRGLAPSRLSPSAESAAPVAQPPAARDTVNQIRAAVEKSDFRTVKSLFASLDGETQSALLENVHSQFCRHSAAGAAFHDNVEKQKQELFGTKGFNRHIIKGIDETLKSL